MYGNMVVERGIEGRWLIENMGETGRGSEAVVTKKLIHHCGAIKNYE